MVSVQIAHEETPNIGKKRWSIPEHLFSDKFLTKAIKESGVKALEKISGLDGTRTQEHNPQTIWASFKSEITEVAKAREKAIVPKIIQQQRQLEDALNRIKNSDDSLEEDKIFKAAEITTKIHDLKLKGTRRFAITRLQIARSTMRQCLVNGSKLIKKGSVEI